jgi:predicted nucleic acid-binding protein
VKRSPRLFLDASVWIAAAGSPTGGSALVLAWCRQGHAKPVGSRRVLLEAERNIRDKLGEEVLLRFYRELAALDLELVEPPTPQEIAAQSQILSPKDAHVLAAALKGRTDILLTLDRKHLLTPSVLKADLPFQIMTPGDFLRRLVSSG